MTVISHGLTTISHGLTTISHGLTTISHGLTTIIAWSNYNSYEQLWTYNNFHRACSFNNNQGKTRNIHENSQIVLLRYTIIHECLSPEKSVMCMNINTSLLPYIFVSNLVCLIDVMKHVEWLAYDEYINGEHHYTSNSWDCYIIPAKPLHNSDTVSVHFNHFYCMWICDKLSRHLYMLTYVYLNVDGCWLTSHMP